MSISDAVILPDPVENAVRAFNAVNALATGTALFVVTIVRQVRYLAGDPRLQIERWLMLLLQGCGALLLATAYGSLEQLLAPELGLRVLVSFMGVSWIGVSVWFQWQWMNRKGGR